MVHVWGWDPGETTGWCHISVHNNEQVGIFNCGETDILGVGNLLNDNAALRTVVVKHEIETAFVVEKFVMNSKITQSPWSLETTGLIRYFSSIYHVPLTFQTPGAAKQLIPNEIIKRLGLYESGKGHAMDAVRHALYFLIVKKGLLKDCLKA